MVAKIGNLGWERIRKHRVEEKTWEEKKVRFESRLRRPRVTYSFSSWIFRSFVSASSRSCSSAFLTCLIISKKRTTRRSSLKTHCSGSFKSPSHCLISFSIVNCELSTEWPREEILDPHSLVFISSVLIHRTRLSSPQRGDYWRMLRGD